MKLKFFSFNNYKSFFYKMSEPIIFEHCVDNFIRIFTKGEQKKEVMNNDLFKSDIV